MIKSTSIQIVSSPEAIEKWETYPPHVKERLIQLRDLVVKSATASEYVDAVKETLKWGEPSYITKHGSTLRMDWKEKNPEQFALYFQCTSKLVPTFQRVFGNSLKYEKTRAIIFKLDEDIPENEIIECIKAALNYHKVKHLPDLGINSVRKV